MKVSSKAIEKIKAFEGFEPKRYICPAGKATIGYGHVLNPKEISTITSITEKEAEKAKLIDETLLSAEYTPIHIDKQNIVSMILDRVKLKQDIQGSSLQKLENKLKELV